MPRDGESSMRKPTLEHCTGQSTDPLRRCIRCRRQKIKCSGAAPCHTCQKRRLTCKFDDHRQKVLVDREYVTFSLIHRLVYDPTNTHCDSILARLKCRARDNGEFNRYQPLEATQTITGEFIHHIAG